MSTACPNGHESEWPDWCSVCGERLGAAATAAPTSPSPESSPDPTPPAASAATPPSGPACSNCGQPRHEHDVFCESCGYDFASGSLPDAPQSPDASDEAHLAPMHVKVSVDPDFFAASVGDVELTLPDPIPDTTVVPLVGVRILIGRQSTSRGIFPEIDVQALTADPAVSSRHAMLERSSSGAWTFTDLGSTNGSFLTAAADEAVEAGVALDVAAGSSVYIGAWTRLDLAETIG